MKDYISWLIDNGTGDIIGVQYGPNTIYFDADDEAQYEYWRSKVEDPVDWGFDGED